MADNPDYKNIITEKFKNPQWRMGIALFMTFLFIFIWSQVISVKGQRYVDISYSQFIEQLQGNNIYSVRIRNLHVKGRKERYYKR
jgi:hypothetical protein